ncbi:hypothetical protein DVA67_005790 [Solirubrobacter sp. CPCC 204708]|uniref:Uncharacterized protein n=1 Tax=Solirubrobacter deserti TaxID=2282478 RepID=A0ABT4RC58_9ACTN|nr:hypothetical protein [Solirubrobacter deserti]MBE2315477.1 hypothetical protein [Solirubrobacter deserti]MDA0136117.1 hypothetical protein [Solirubrobacter deserti]
MTRRGVPVSDEVLRSMQMTAGNQAVGRAIAEGRITPDTPAGEPGDDAPREEPDRDS